MAISHKISGNAMQMVVCRVGDGQSLYAFLMPNVGVLRHGSLFGGRD